MDGWREILIDTRPLLLHALSAVRGRAPSLEAVLVDMTHERDNALALPLLSARDSASDDASLDLLPQLSTTGGGGLPRPVADAPPGSDGKLSPRCLGGVFLNRDSLILPAPLPSAPRLLSSLLRASFVGERGLSLLLRLTPVLGRLPWMLPPFLELESVLVCPFLLRASDELDVPITDRR